MALWDKSLRIFQCLGDHGKQGVRRMAQQTGLSTSRVHRLTQAMERRHRHPASWCWETADGRPCLTRLGGATRSPFGLKRGVGIDTLRAFCTPRRLATQRGWSPAAWRGVRQAVEAARLQTAGGWEQDGRAGGEGRERSGAVDATCVARRILVCLDRSPGSLRLEAVAADRPSATWQAWVEERRTG